MTTLRNIGNSMGILIPKSLISQAKLDGAELAFQVTEDGLLIKPIKKTRTDWQNQIESALKTHVHDVDNEWLDSDLVEPFDD